MHNVTEVPYTLLLPQVTGVAVLGLLGLFGNVNIILATIKSNKLRSKSNYLICISAVFDLISDIGFLHYAAFTYSKRLKISQRECFYTLSYMVFTMQVGCHLIWINGIDKLLATKLPTKHRNWSNGRYQMITVMPGVIFAAVLIGVGYLESSEEEIVFVCMPPTALRGNALHIWLLSGVVLNVCVVVTYVWMLKIMKKKTAKISDGPRPNFNRVQEENQKKITKSLATTAAIYIGGWLITMFTMVSLEAFLEFSPEIEYQITLYVGWNAAVSVGCNYYVFFWRSSIYRRAFRELLGMKNPVPVVTFLPSTRIK